MWDRYALDSVDQNVPHFLASTTIVPHLEVWDTLSPTLPSVGLGAACPTLGSVGLSVGQEWVTLRSVGHFGPHYEVFRWKGEEKKLQDGRRGT